MTNEKPLSEKIFVPLVSQGEPILDMNSKDVALAVKRLKESICECCFPENIKDEPCENGDCPCEIIDEIMGRFK